MSAQAHHREKSRTRSQLIREKEDSMSRDQSISISAENAPSLKQPQPSTHQSKKQQHTQNAPPLVHNISGQSGNRSRKNSNTTFKLNTIHSNSSIKMGDTITPDMIQQVLDSQPSTVKHLRSQSLKSHKNLVNGYGDLNEQDSVTFQHEVGDKDSNGLGTKSQSIREMFAVISQSFIYKYDELYHQFTLIHAKYQNLKTDNQLLHEQNMKLKKSKNEFEKQNKELHLRMNELDTRIKELEDSNNRLKLSADLGLTIDANELQLSIPTEDDDDNQPEPQTDNEYEITPAPVSYDTADEDKKDTQKETQKNKNKVKETRKDTPIHNTKHTVMIKSIIGTDPDELVNKPSTEISHDDSKEEEKKSDDGTGTNTSSDVFVFKENLIKATNTQQQQHQHTNSDDDDDSQILYGSQNINQLLDNIDINTINEESDIPPTRPFIQESESFQISVNGTPVGGHRPSVPSSLFQQNPNPNVNTKEPPLIARESVLNLHGTGKVADLANRFESPKDHQYDSLHNLRNEYSLSGSTSFRTTSKARHKHKRKPRNVKKHKSVKLDDEDDEKSPKHGTHLYKNTPTRPNTLSPRKLSKQKSKPRSMLKTPTIKMTKTASKKDVTHQSMRNKPKPSNTKKDTSYSSKGNKSKAKTPYKGKSGPQSSKKGYHYGQKNGHSQKSSMLQLFSKGKKQKNKSKK
mmetsp:Transcript_64365/g.57864  ORF Transcript_64365/g.57864 Transcript_64365/m.57864 type:complete len:686 (-) Transcript_64365:12-2069(-)